MTIPKDILRDNPGLGDWSILTGWRGSVSHGTYVPNKDPNSIDDKDIMAVCVPPPDFYHGLREYNREFYPQFSRETQEIKRDEWDIVVYEARKFIHLLSVGNPNVLALLWLEPNLYIKRTDAGNFLLENRSLFVGKHVYHSFAGYAHSQLHKMTHLEFKGYMGDKRKKLVEKHGYDTKNASHLIRLLRMAIEFLSSGELQVQRPDASQLLEIKRGEWGLERVKEEADRLFKRAEEAYIHSKLPVKPDMVAINQLTANIVEMVNE